MTEPDMVRNHLLTRYLINQFWEFHEIYNFDAVGTKMNLLSFEVKRSKIKVMAKQRVIK